MTFKVLIDSWEACYVNVLLGKSHAHMCKVLALMGQMRFETPDPILIISHPDLYHLFHPSALYPRVPCKT